MTEPVGIVASPVVAEAWTRSKQPQPAQQSPASGGSYPRLESDMKYFTEMAEKTQDTNPEQSAMWSRLADEICVYLGLHTPQTNQDEGLF